MRRLKFTFYIIFALFSVFAENLPAREHEADSLVRAGDRFHSMYDFAKAVQAYEDALVILEDTLSVSYDSLKVLSVRDKLLLSENGRSMSAFADTPVVVARHKFPVSDFHLYYPLPDRSWRDIPNQLDSSAANGLSRALYAPDEAERIFFSAEDNDGIRNIYMTELKDTLWTYPSLLNEHMTSASDEIYPMLSPDGRKMYFSSEGLYGVGGFDIYVSEWSDDDNDWSVPMNMGFPYSSPADDFLFVSTGDGEHTVFASNRGCGADSVWVYVLEFDSMPVRSRVDEPERLAEISCLEPADVTDASEDASSEIPENVDTRRYAEKMNEVRALRDSLEHHESSLEDDRNRFAFSNDDAERMRLTEAILLREQRIPQLQDSLRRANAIVQDIQMEFLAKGVFIDHEQMMRMADREVVGESTGYVFSRKSPGGPLDIRIMEPEKKFDYSFMVLDKGQFAEDNTIPGGIVYQIQMFSSSKKASVDALKGLSPVFEHRNSNGKYIYRAGLFNSYNDVLSKLNTVKRAGFRNAFIVAFIDSVEVSVSKARAEEKKRPAVRYRVEMVPETGGLDPELADGIRQQAAGKDIARSEREDGRFVYSVGPFEDKAQAEKVMQFVKAMGLDEVSCVPVADESINK